MDRVDPKANIYSMNQIIEKSFPKIKNNKIQNNKP